MQKGQSLIELLIAIALAAVVIPGIMTGLIASREGKAQEGQRLQAMAYLKEAEEAVRSAREAGWSNIASNNTYHPVAGASSWSLATGSESIDGNFTRQVVISSVQRDNTTGNIVLSGGVNDPSTKLAVYTVSWTTPIAGSVTSTEYLQRHLRNTTHVDTTQTDFNGGTFNNTETNTTGGGSVRLSNVGSGSYNFVDDYTSPGSYTYDSNKIEVLNSYAELKPTSVPASTTQNPGFDTSLSPWFFEPFGASNSQTGTRIATGGNPGAYAQINFPRANNLTDGGYLRQSFTTVTSSPTGSLTFNWKVTGYDATPTSFHLYAWLDTVATGAPTTQIWDSGNITATSGWSGTVTVNVAPQIVTPGTYYIKVGGVVNHGAINRGPFTIGFDNVLLSSSGITSYNIYDSTSPTIYPIASFVPGAVSSWASFTSTEVTNGGSIMYQLSDDNGVTWKYRSLSGWAVATLPTDYSSAATVNQFISTFSAASGQIKVRAFLISNGTQFVRLDKITIGYNGSVFPNQGDFISASIDAGANAGFNNIVWTEVNTAYTTTKFQIATNSDNATWSFVGPDGTSGTYFTGGYGTIPLNAVSGRYLRYKIYFTSANSDIPYVTDVTVNYSP